MSAQLALDAQKPCATESIVVFFLLAKAEECEELGGLTPLQINKLVFVCHGWTLGIHGHPLIDNSRAQIQAWKYGPVVEGVYYMLRPFGRSKVTFDSFCSHIANRIALNDSTLTDAYRQAMLKKLEKFRMQHTEVAKVLDDVFENYSDYTGSQLITITHQRGSPWDRCYRQRRYNLFSRIIPIPDSLIKSYYQQLSSS